MKKTISVIMIIAFFAISACTQNKDDNFAIYLVAQEITAAEVSRVNIYQLILDDKPFLSSADIISYDKISHTIELTNEAYARVQQLFEMQVRVTGIPFVVCVGPQRIYTGAWMTPLSSMSYDGVIIMQPWNTNDTTIQIGLGYPGPDAFKGRDPRADPRLIEALEQANKLSSNGK